MHTKLPPSFWAYKDRISQKSNPSLMDYWSVFRRIDLPLTDQTEKFIDHNTFDTKRCHILSITFIKLSWSTFSVWTVYNIFLFYLAMNQSHQYYCISKMKPSYLKSWTFRSIFASTKQFKSIKWCRGKRIQEKITLSASD